MAIDSTLTVAPVAKTFTKVKTAAQLHAGLLIWTRRGRRRARRKRQGGLVAPAERVESGRSGAL